MRHIAHGILNSSSQSKYCRNIEVEILRLTLSLNVFLCVFCADSRPLPDVAMTGKCTRECDEYGHSDACWMPVRTSPERRPKATPPKLSTFNSSSAGCSGAEPATSSDPLAVANGEPSHLLGDRNRNLLNKKMASSSSSSSAYDAFGSAAFSASEETSRPVEEIPLAPTGEYKPTQCGTLTRREVYL